MKKSCMVKYVICYVICYVIFVTPYPIYITDVTSTCRMLAASWCIGALKRRPNEGRLSLPGRITHQPESRATFSASNRRMQLKQASLSTAASRMPFQSVSMALFVLSDFQFFLSFLFSPSFPRLPYVLILSPLLASFNPPSLTSSLAPR